VTPGALKRVLAVAFRTALAGVDLEARVREAMPRVPGGVRAGAILAVGKAAPAMARGALAAADERFTRVLVVAPDGTPAAFSDGRVELLRASHPDPDARSVAAARRALAVAREADFVVALVSGGASSLVFLPVGPGLEVYARVFRALLRAGATVREVNVVRRHACRVKGGGLAREAGGPVRTLLASDVLGGAAEDVGSGPTVADPTTLADARRILARFTPGLAAPPLRESLKPRAVAPGRLGVRVVARPEDLARAVAAELRGKLRTVRVLRPSTAPVELLAREYVERARRLEPGEALVRAAEPPVTVVGARPGRGGRSTHLALRVAAELGRGVVLLAGASDGVDGASASGGAVVDRSVAERAGRGAIEAALAGFDSGTLLRSLGMTLPLAPSGTNLADVHVLARA
jgi:hydroxypyruvate reductase